MITYDTTTSEYQAKIKPGLTSTMQMNLVILLNDIRSRNIQGESRSNKFQSKFTLLVSVKVNCIAIMAPEIMDATPDSITINSPFPVLTAWDRLETWF